MSEVTEIATAGATGAMSVWLDKNQFDQLARTANMLAKSSILPQQYQGKPGDCLIIMDIAARTNSNPIFVAQNMSIVRGNPSWKGQFVTALLKNCGLYSDVEHIWIGEPGEDSFGCYVTAVRKSDGKRVNGPEVTVAMAKSEGWWASNAKWRNLTKLMLNYRASSFFGRTECPEVLMGMPMADEVYETVPESTASAADLTAALKGGEK